MAITAAAININHSPGGEIGATKWNVRGDSADVSGAETLKAAVASKKHYITRFRISCAAAVAGVWLQDEDDNQITAKFHFPATGGNFIEVDCSRFPRYLPTNKALEIKSAGAGAVGVEVEGYTI